MGGFGGAHAQSSVAAVIRIRVECTVARKLPFVLLWYKARRRWRGRIVS